MSQPRHGFSQDEKLRKSKEFSLVCRRGRRLDSDHFRLFLLKTGQVNRLGLTVSKKVGGAVERNTIKRRLREVFRRNKSELPGIDLVIIAKRGAADLGSNETGLELSNLIGRIR